ncbi:Fur family transcriptional regulator [Polaribacter sp. Asnod1-A03]|uniref:Fur family transcriptional regulator n=1 Tax=Polaribacter sp. Asnod1-A03 TaxID=3160581 RepID=UPI00386BCF55
MNRRNTPAKEAILSLLSSSKRALSQDVIERQLDIKINRATIYRVLNRFYEDDIVHRIVAEDGKQYFAICEKNEKNQHHFHFRCSSCDTIECLHIPVDYKVPKGYNVKNANCVLTGSCNDCS